MFGAYDPALAEWWAGLTKEQKALYMKFVSLKEGSLSDTDEIFNNCEDIPITPWTPPPGGRYYRTAAGKLALRMSDGGSDVGIHKVAVVDQVSGTIDKGTTVASETYYRNRNSPQDSDTEGVNVNVGSWKRDSINIALGAGGATANTVIVAKNTTYAIEIRIVDVAAHTLQDAATARQIEITGQDEDDAACEGDGGHIGPVYLHDTTNNRYDLGGAHPPININIKTPGKNKDAELDITGGIQNEEVSITYEHRLVVE